jgi:hypothetical protein
VTAATVSAGTIGNSGASIQGATGAFTGAVTGNTFAGIAVSYAMYWFAANETPPGLIAILNLLSSPFEQNTY